MLHVQEILTDLAAQKEEIVEENVNDASTSFAYRSATREIAINAKVSSNHFMVTNMIHIYVFVIQLNWISTIPYCKFFIKYIIFCSYGMN